MSYQINTDERATRLSLRSRDGPPGAIGPPGGLDPPGKQARNSVFHEMKNRTFTKKYEFKQEVLL